MDLQSTILVVALGLVDLVRNLAETSFYVLGTFAFVRFLRTEL